MRTGANSAIGHASGLDFRPRRWEPLEQARPLLARGRRVLPGARREQKASSSVVKMADDLHDALQQNQMEKGPRHWRPRWNPVGRFHHGVAGLREAKSLTNSAAFAAALAPAVACAAGRVSAEFT